MGRKRLKILFVEIVWHELTTFLKNKCSLLSVPFMRKSPILGWKFLDFQSAKKKIKNGLKTLENTRICMKIIEA